MVGRGFVLWYSDSLCSDGVQFDLVMRIGSGYHYTIYEPYVPEKAEELNTRQSE